MQLRHHFSRAPHINKLAASLIYRARSYVSLINYPQPSFVLFCIFHLSWWQFWLLKISRNNFLFFSFSLFLSFFFFIYFFRVLILIRIEIWYVYFLYIFTDDNGYWTYLGSLTTPPCNESVTWILFKKCIEVSHHQLNIFRNLRKFSRGEECPCHENHGAVSV